MANAKNGMIWSAVERFSVQGTQFLLSLVIARLVTPADFGLIAMLTIFLAIAQVFTDSGFGNALIQKKDRCETDFSTVFYFNIGIAAILYTVLYVCAPLIARFYNQPILMEVTRFVGINLILQSLYLVQRTKLKITLDYKLIAELSFAAMILSGTIGIFLAYHGYGVWALVFQTLANNTLLALLFWICTKWRPIFVFSTKSFKTLFSFGSKLLASSLLHTIYLNLYSLVIGKFYNPSDVGYYNRSSTIAQYASSNLVAVMNNVIYPLQCEHQTDKKWIVESFKKFLRLTCYIVFPIMVCLSVLSKPLIIIILTDKWIESAILLSILSVSYMWIAIGVVNNSLIMASGHSGLYLKAEIIKKVVAVIILIITLPFGLIWLCIGFGIYNILDLFIIISFTRKIYPLGFRKQIASISGILFLTLMSGIISALFCSICHNAWIEIIGGFFIFFLIYLGGTYFFKFNELNLFLSVVRK